MTSTRVLHVPGHTPYARKLTDTAFSIVNGTGNPEVPFTASVDWLLGVKDWTFFDVVHLHSVELVTKQSLSEMIIRLRMLDKRLVFTAHDVLPNIEGDRHEFQEKTRLVVRNAGACMTLTRWASDEICKLTAGDDVARPVTVVPHGFAVEPGRYPVGRRLSDHPAVGVYGALRPNRALDTLAAAWRQLATHDFHRGVALRIILRSVNAADVERYASTLAALTQLIKDGLNVDLRISPTAVSDAEIVDFHRTCSVILLPYGWCTHSGQLELCLDLGVPALAPRVGGLESQLEVPPRVAPLVTWFDGEQLSEGTGAGLAAQIKAAIATATACRNNIGLPAAYRREEHERLVRHLRAAYLRPMPAIPDGSDYHD